jgi:hypothetical protein
VWQDVQQLIGGTTLGENLDAGILELEHQAVSEERAVLGDRYA